MSKTRVRAVSRERDDQVLDWLSRYEQGESIVSIAKKAGIPNYQTVQSALRSVLDTLSEIDNPQETSK